MKCGVLGCTEELPSDPKDARRHIVQHNTLVNLNGCLPFSLEEEEPYFVRLIIGYKADGELQFTPKGAIGGENSTLFYSFSIEVGKENIQMRVFALPKSTEAAAAAAAFTKLRLLIVYNFELGSAFQVYIPIGTEGITLPKSDIASRLNGRPLTFMCINGKSLTFKA